MLFAFASSTLQKSLFGAVYLCPSVVLFIVGGVIFSWIYTVDPFEVQVSS